MDEPGSTNLEQTSPIAVFIPNKTSKRPGQGRRMAKTQLYGKDILRVVTLAVTFLTSQQRHIENKGTALQSQVR